jgi:hypothetical protein
LSGQYLDNTFANPEDFKCTSCPRGASCLGNVVWGDVVARQGWWRIPWSNRTFKMCPYEDDCLGFKNGDAALVSSSTAINNTLNEGCLAGTMGPVCSICIEGFNRDGGTCSICENNAVPLRIGLLVLFVLLLYAATVVFRRRLRAKWLKYRSLWRDLLRVMSINITFLQINSSLPHVLAIQWPREWHRFVQKFAFVNIDIMSLIGISCIGGYNYYISFLIMICLPISILILAVLNYNWSKKAMSFRLNRLSAKQKNNMEEEALHSLFHLADADRSGEIDASELAGILKALGMNVNVATAHTLIERIDQVPNAHGVFLLNEEQFLDAMLTGFMQTELDKITEMIRDATSVFKSTAAKSQSVARKASADLRRRKRKTGLFDKQELVKWTLRKNIVANSLSGATQLLVSW